MTRISIRNLDAKTVARLRRNAQQRGQSLNRYLLSLLRDSPDDGSARPRLSHGDLDRLAGTWSGAQVKAFERATAPFAEVDEAAWR